MAQKHRFTLAAIALLAFAGAQALAQTAGAPAHHKTMMLPKNTPIVVQTYNAVNSATFHAGEHMAYTVSDDVIVDGAIIAKAGDSASGLIEDAQEGHKTHAGALGHAIGPKAAVAGAAVSKAESKGADLRLSVTALQSFCGTKIPLSFVRSEYRKPSRFHESTTVQIAKGQKYIATVAEDTTVCAVATTRTPVPVPQDALPADKSP